MKRPTFRFGGVLLVTVLLFSASPLFAEDIPPDGLLAESENRYQDAISIYEKALEQNPQRVDLLLQIAEIHNVMENPQAMVKALEQAAELVPNDPEMFFKLSQGYSWLEQPKKALASINKAMELKPDFVPYHKEKAKLAVWLGEYDLAIENFAVVLETNPDDEESRLAFAKAQSWKGDYDGSAKNFEKYLEGNPQNLTAWREYSQVQAQRGEYASALEAEKRYRNLGGDPSLLVAEIPLEGVLAESENRFQDAISIYEEALEQNPQRVDLLLRLADIHNDMENPQGMVNALEKLTELMPDDPEMFFKLSQGYSWLEQPKKALEAINRAVELKPGFVPYHKERAKLAVWLSEYDLAIESFAVVLEANPDDDESRLASAKAQSWKGDYDGSANNFKKYLQNNPQKLEELMAYSRVQSWQDEYAGALEAMEKFREFGGDQELYDRAKARYLARVDRPEKSLSIVEPYVSNNPRDYDALYTQALALKQARRFKTAMHSLKIVEQIHPDTKETKDLSQIVRTPLRPNISADTHFSTDSDSIDISGVSVTGFYPINEEKYFRVGVDWENLHADASSGLNAVSGAEDVQRTGGWVGLEGRLRENLWALGQLGFDTADENAGTFLYKAGIAYRPDDNLRLNFLSSHGLYAVSPLTLSLDVERTANRISAIWTPDIDYVIETEFGYDFFSDDNQSWLYSLYPRRSVLRSKWLNLDFGVSGVWEGFKNDLNNGYYDPGFYQQYLGVITAFIEFSDNDNISIVVAPGIERDEDIDKFQFSANVNFELTIGLYRDWMFKVRGDFIDTTGVVNQSYNEKSINFSLTRRF